MSELAPGDFPFPLADPIPPPVMISRPCGCTFMDIGEGGPPAQISWCDDHDPGYEPPGEDEPEVEVGPDGLIPPGDCGHLDGTPHSGKVHPIEMMCLHEHWTGDQWCDGHLEAAAAMWWPCGRCRHDGGKCPTIVRVCDTGRQFRFPAEAIGA